MQDIYRAIAEALSKDTRVLAAYVIGSTIRGETTAESDFDLAVIVPSRSSVNEGHVYDLIRHISFPKDLDLSVVDSSSSPIFLFYIVRDGILIYEASPEARARFEASVLHRYYDTAHIRSIYARYLPERFAGGAYAR